MTYEVGEAGRVDLDASDCGRHDFWTFDAVEERLIDAIDLWRRSPGGGRWPFAGDAPWHLMTRKTRIAEGGFKGRELQLRMQAEDAEEAADGRAWRRGALSRDEVARRDEATEWLGWVAADSRKVVLAALAQRATGAPTSTGGGSRPRSMPRSSTSASIAAIRGRSRHRRAVERGGWNRRSCAAPEKRRKKPEILPCVAVKVLCANGCKYRVFTKHPGKAHKSDRLGRS
jgi:hypothetical protein